MLQKTILQTSPFQHSSKTWGTSSIPETQQKHCQKNNKKKPRTLIFENWNTSSPVISFTRYSGLKNQGIDEITGARETVNMLNNKKNLLLLVFCLNPLRTHVTTSKLGFVGKILTLSQHKVRIPTNKTSQKKNFHWNQNTTSFDDLIRAVKDQCQVKFFQFVPRKFWRGHYF